MPAGGMRVDLHDPAIRALLGDPSGPVGRELAHLAQVVTRGAKRRCPVSPAGSHGRPSGHLRSSIGWDLVAGTGGLHADIGTDVDYALYVELGTKPHKIKPRNADALAFFWARAGRFTIVPRLGPYPRSGVYVREDGVLVIRKGYVDHPGTTAQPFLRPALDDLRGGG